MLRVQDLGCGDADTFSRVISRTNIRPLLRSYTGVELSKPAITIARVNLARFASAKGAYIFQSQVVLSCMLCAQQLSNGLASSVRGIPIFPN